MTNVQEAATEPKHHDKRFTDVPSHPDFVKMEEELLKRWYHEGIVEEYLHKNDDSKEKFSFLDGPITANNPMGVHHGRGRTYKDLWQRYHNMRGKRQRFQNGFDCQGLWVEVEVEKELGFRSKKDILDYGVEKFVNKCKERVLKFAGIQTEQSKRLGMFLDWPNSYYTMSEENNYSIWNFLRVCHQRGWIYKGHDSVPWCPRCETAISQHEMLTEDYKTVTHKSIYFSLPLVEREGEYLLVWTTTPWTLPANIAVAVDPELEYSLVQGTDGYRYWVAKDAVERVFGKTYAFIHNTIEGKELVNLHYRGPFDQLSVVQEVAQQHPDSFHLVIATDPQIMPITTSEGTGLVHTAVSAGSEDFKLGRKYGLPMIPVITDTAEYLPTMGFLAGKNAKKHPELILDFLVEEDKKPNQHWVFKIEDYTHRYPACWRCKTELVWKVTDEWYIAMDRRDITDKKKRTLREEMMDVAKRINWIPAFGLDRELDWLTNMHDWLISKKNRFWGLALPIYECTECGWFDVISGKKELQKRAVSGWEKFEGHTPHKPWIDEVKIACKQCGKPVSRIEPVGNPWLDAGIVPFSTMPPEWFPADFITESFPGQFKNWFYALIVMSTVLAKRNPFKTVLGFESVVGEDGRPMHKSWGNMVEFNEGASRIGVDVMRWMYARALPTAVLPFGYKVADEIRRRFLLILWNSYRFFVSQANADGWEPSTQERGKNRHLEHVLDRWIMSRFYQTVGVVTTSLNKFSSAPATEAAESFVDDFSTWYIRRSRDRVGPAAPASADKDQAYHTMFTILTGLPRLLAPIMPYLTDHIYTNLTRESSVHLASWPDAEEGLVDQMLLDQMAVAREIATQGHAQRKASGLPLRQPLVSVKVAKNGLALSPEIGDLLQAELNVKNVVVDPVGGEELSVSLDTTLTDGLKAEGRARELIRTIQQLRREAGTELTDEIIAMLPDWPQEFEEEIKKATLARALEKSDQPGIKRV